MGKRFININPKTLGLTNQTKIISDGEQHYFILKDRKSRIIMKDGHQVLNQAKTIRKIISGAIISLVTPAPVCSKTSRFLKKNGINTLSFSDIQI
tara:strand:+ start:267 stop:551 length:285 start_codon:yes stop_codon:yes gene_type:complete